MGAAKDLWLAEVERIEEDISTGQLTLEEGYSRLRSKGFDCDEALSMALAAAGLDP